IIPAHNISKYGSMGSKVDNPTNKNMLTQTAANLTQIKVGADWKTIGAGITTWNDNWQYRKPDGSIEPAATGTQKIWRKHKTYTWKGDIDADGAYVGYTGDLDGFVWGSTQSNPKWINTSTVNLYDHYSMPLESQDINGNKVATKMGDKDTKVFSVSNAGYDQMFYSGAEDLNTSTKYFSGGVYTDNSALLSDKYHTGKYSVEVGINKKAFAVKPNAGKYKVSVWVNREYKDSPWDYTVLKIEDGAGSVRSIPFNSGEKVLAGNWVQLNFYAEVQAGEEVSVSYTSGRAASYFDDFRMHPVESSMTSYVYNEWDELSDILGANNMATHYEYDQAGRLIKTYTEVQNASGIQGGFKLAKQIKYNYKEIARYDTNGDGILDISEDPEYKLEFYLHIDNLENPTTTVTARVQRGTGDYEYRWSSGLNNSSDPPPFIGTGGFGNSNQITISTGCGGDKGTSYRCQVRDKNTGQIVERLGSHVRYCSTDPTDPQE
ncbi:hypothetical protein N8834_00580, partial [bacterium]|nr:hypothetical protein [bacterium]